MKRKPKKPDQVKEARRAARAIIGEPSRGRKRGPHGDGRRPFPVTDPEDDAPDGVRLNGYIRVGTRWEPDPEVKHGIYDDDVGEEF